MDFQKRDSGCKHLCAALLKLQEIRTWSPGIVLPAIHLPSSESATHKLIQFCPITLLSSQTPECAPDNTDNATDALLDAMQMLQIVHDSIAVASKVTDGSMGAKKNSCRTAAMPAMPAATEKVATTMGKTETVQLKTRKIQMVLMITVLSGLCRKLMTSLFGWALWPASWKGCKSIQNLLDGVLS